MNSASPRKNAKAAAAKNTRGEPPGPHNAPTARVVPLRMPERWHDPLRLIKEDAPSEAGRVVLHAVCLLAMLLIAWAALGKLDIIAAAEGRLVPQTLVKIVQPAEAGVVRQILVEEGASVKAGQVLARLDPTLAHADRIGISSDLATQRLQMRRLEAELVDRPMQPENGDDPERFRRVHSQYVAHRRAFLDGLEQERSLLVKAEHERRSASEVLAKLRQSLPTYQKTADAYSQLEMEGFIGGIAAAEKRRDVIEKSKDLDAQLATVTALNATVAAQRKKLSQLESAYRSDLEKELSEARARIDQLQPNLDKTAYKEGLLELRAPQDAVVKDLATTTIGAVVQPGAVVLTLVPKDELLFADVNIKNEDVGFVQVGQDVQIKLQAYPFQQYGMLAGKVIHVGADAADGGKINNAGGSAGQNEGNQAATFKARVRLDRQALIDPSGNALPITAGMQVTAEINQGKRTVLEYLLSPVKKALGEAARER